MTLVNTEFFKEVFQSIQKGFQFWIFLLQFESKNQELIVVYNEGRNKPIELKIFYKVQGLIRWKSNSSSFAWRKDHGIITGNLAQLLNIFKNKHFKNFKMIPKVLYDYETCTTEFEKPCPYYHGALSSLIMPTSLALLTFLFLSCCSSCTCCSCCSCCLIQGNIMYTVRTGVSIYFKGAFNN